MKNTLGENFFFFFFGESDDQYIGVVLVGVARGIVVNSDIINN